MTLTRKWMPSPNNSSRGGAGVRLIVLHTAEGALTIESLGNFFASSSSGVSSHAGADDKANTVGEYVTRDRKAWTASNANPVAVQIELCAFAAWSTDEWMAHPTMLANTAAWIAEEAAAFGLPIARLSAGEAQGGGRGVCQHNDLGSWGGGHWDCGPGFPMDYVLDLARGGGTPPKPKAEADMTPGQCRDKAGHKWFFVVGDDRSMFASVDGGDFFKVGGVWTSGLDAYCEADGLIVVAGRDGGGALVQCLIWTEGSPEPGRAPEFHLIGGHIYPPG